VAKLRAVKTDANPLVFRINMEAGHGGKSGRFRRYRDTPNTTPSCWSSLVWRSRIKSGTCPRGQTGSTLA
jgi:hypothetical protein